MADKRLLADLGTRIAAIHQHFVSRRDASKVSVQSQLLHQQSTEMTTTLQQLQTLQTQVETLQEQV